MLLLHTNNVTQMIDLEQIVFMIIIVVASP